MDKNDIKTTDGSLFTYRMSAQMARLVYVRFGRNLEEATAAWRRMMQNTTTEEDFQTLVHDGILNSFDDSTMTLRLKKKR